MWDTGSEFWVFLGFWLVTSTHWCFLVVTVRFKTLLDLASTCISKHHTHLHAFLIVNYRLSQCARAPCCFWPFACSAVFTPPEHCASFPSAWAACSSSQCPQWKVQNVEWFWSVLLMDVDYAIMMHLVHTDFSYIEFYPSLNWVRARTIYY